MNFIQYLIERMIFATYSDCKIMKCGALVNTNINIVLGICKSIKIMANGTIVIKPLPETWGTDSHVSVYMNKFVYSIGGFR